MEKEKICQLSAEQMLEVILQQLNGYRQDVRSAIETAMNTSYELMDTKEVCGKMNISPHMLHRYVERFSIPVHRIGKRNFYFMPEINNAIITGLRIWNH